MYPVNSSGVKTASAQISTQRGFLAGIDMISPSSGTATLTVYDSADSNVSGKLVLAEMEVDAGMPSCNHEYLNPVSVNKGIYAVLVDSTGSANYIIRYAMG